VPQNLACPRHTGLLECEVIDFAEGALSHEGSNAVSGKEDDAVVVDFKMSEAKSNDFSIGNQFSPSIRKESWTHTIRCKEALTEYAYWF